MQFKELETERLILRKLEERDIPVFWEQFYNDYEKYKFFEYEEIKEYAAFKERTEEQLKRYEQKEYYKWSIVEKTSGFCIGMINLHHYDSTNQQIKVGYFLFPNYRKKGYALESLQCVISFAFDTLKIHRIIATTIAGNTDSNKVLLKAGFQLEGTKRKDHYIDGTYYDSHIFGLLESDISPNHFLDKEE